MTRNLWLSVVALIASIATHYITGPYWSKLIIDALVLGVSAGMMWTWSPAAGRALSRGATGGSDKVIITVWLAWTMYFVQRVYTLANTALDRPEWLTTSIAPQIIATLIFIAGMYGLLAPASDAASLPRRQMAVIVSGWFVAGLVAGGAAVYALLTSGV